MFPFLQRIHQLLSPKHYSSQRSALLRRIGDRIRNSLELRVVLQTAVDEVAALLKLDRCFFFWYFEDLERIQVVCEHLTEGRPSNLGHHPLSQFGAASALIQRGESFVNRGCNGGVSGSSVRLSLSRWLSPQPQEPTHNLQILGTRANLLIPVSGQESSLGYIACLSEQPRRWSPDEVEFVQAIAQHLEIAIRQAQLYEKTQKQARRERLVNQITSQTRQSLDLETILTQATEQLLEALDVDRCLVHLVENWDDSDLAVGESQVEQKRAVFRRKHLFEVCREPFPPSIQDFDTNGPITQWVIQTRQQVVIPDIIQDARIGPDNAEYQLAQIQSSLVVPVQANGTLQAILYLNQCSQIRYWSRGDQKLAQAVADQLAISIQQGHLYAQMRQQAAESAAQAEYLAATLQDLRQTQAQLIQSEKMSSLGHLVGGVAHEINNPISFIYGNIPYVERYIEDLNRLLHAYQAQYSEPNPALEKLIEEVELDFLRKDLPQILNSMKSGAERIREIIQSLRSFSRLDESHCKTADIHKGIDSTLAVLRSHIKTEIVIARRYAEQLPLIECYPQQLNQVFLNLLMNAIEALGDADRQPLQIEIKTAAFSNPLTGDPWVRIAIADNGCGIPYSVQPKIFDPFFTTKDIGQGAGLGLTASYQTIVNQHRGQLKFRSEPGKGTEFVVEIPVRHSALFVRNRNLSLTPDLAVTPPSAAMACNPAISEVCSS